MKVIVFFLILFAAWVVVAVLSEERARRDAREFLSAAEHLGKTLGKLESKAALVETEARRALARMQAPPAQHGPTIVATGEQLLHAIEVKLASLWLPLLAPTIDVPMPQKMSTPFVHVSEFQPLQFGVPTKAEKAEARIAADRGKFIGGYISVSRLAPDIRTRTAEEKAESKAAADVISTLMELSSLHEHPELGKLLKKQRVC